ncbi:NACHT domain protein [Rhexocercosporidium sp. MPI-PUGE-AT-0058]|nr:NACHT domain protein [Rhexocercosporidium sp. MPI-PUGE-AT-0058]
MPLPRRDQKVDAAKRTIREAFEDLEGAIAPADSHDFGAATLESVQKAALDIENQLAARSSLRNMRRLLPLFSGLQHYSAVVEVLCNGTPYLPWIWAPIKLILKIASDYVEAFDQIIKAYSRIGDSLNRFRILDAAFSQNASFQLTLAVFYADILRFHKQAYTLVRRSCWKIFFLTSWGRFQRRFDNIIDDLKRHEEQIDKEASAHHISEAKDTRDKLEAWRQDALAKLACDEEEQTAGYLQNISTWLKLDDTDQTSIIDKFSTEGTKYPETCGWVLKNGTMASWLKPQPDSPFLWLQGNPGTGKSTIVGKLTTFLRASLPTPLVVTHYCTSSYPVSTQYDKMLRSLLFQLIHANDDLIAHIYWEYVVRKRMASVTALEKLIVTVVTALLGEPGQKLPIYVLLDGLDEVEAEKQCQVITLMRRVSSEAKARGAVLKILVSCRTSPLLEKFLRKQSMLSLSDEKRALEEAICTYSTHRLTADSHRLSQLGLRGFDLTEMGRNIARKADGMFLWARLVLDYVATNIFHSRHEITDAINTLPRELSQFYERILTNTMANFDPRSVERMRQILGWIAFAKRPLRKSEFRSALSFSIGNPTVDELVPSYIFDMCAPLVEQRRDSSFAFIHVSVKDYLQTTHSKLLITEENMIKEHGLATLTCLLSGLETFQAGYPDALRSLRVIKGLHGFHLYANEYWVEYIISLIRSHDAFSQYTALPKAIHDLSEKLDGLGEYSNVFESNEDLKLSDQGLDALKGYRGLYANARIALVARSKKELRDEFEYEARQDSGIALEHAEGLHGILLIYQATIMSILPLQDFPGVTVEELELFKREFRTSAYTCRFPLCPRATAGFERNELRLEHEATHIQRLHCQYAGCQYPPFTSTRALRNHEIKCHETVQGRKRIRGVLALPQHQLESSGQADRNEERLPKGSIKSLDPSSCPSVRPRSRPQKDEITMAQYHAYIEQPASSMHDGLPTVPLSPPDPISQQSHGYPRVQDFRPSEQAESTTLSKHVDHLPISKWRVKVYEKREDGWFDKGTGFCSTVVSSTYVLSLTEYTSKD